MKEFLKGELTEISLEIAELEMLKSVAALEQNYPLASELRDKIKYKWDLVRLLNKIIEFHETQSNLSKQQE